MNLADVHNENCVDTMRRMLDNFIDLTITSPPYDKIRKYNGFSFDIDAVVEELYRVTKPGGMVIWVVGDQTVNGSESLSSFKQAIKFVEHGWKLHDTMIYRKLNPAPNAGTRYQQCFEYMFAFSKGRPKTTNIQLRERRNKCNDKRTYRKKKFSRDEHGEFNINEYFVKDQVPRDNIFEYYVGGGNSSEDKIAHKHPAIFPEKLVEGQILSWSKEGELVYDPFAGSGTVAKVAESLNRGWILSEESKEYCEIIYERLLALKSA